MTRLVEDVRDKAERARAAALLLGASADETRRAAVHAVAQALETHAEAILAANGEDLETARQEGLAPAPLARLGIDASGLRRLAEAVREVAALPDPLGRTLRATRLDEGLDLYQVTVPLGVVAVVFESRPDALVQIAALTLRSGNALIAKGGREARRTNTVLAEVIREAIAREGLAKDALVTLEERAEVEELLKMDELVDLVVPRGSNAFVRHVMDRTHIPVLGHAEGVCHVYVDKVADLDKALAVCLDAKTDHPSACNAAEAFLVHAAIAPRFGPRLRAAFETAGVRVHEDAAMFGREFGALECALAVVGSLDEAIGHVNAYGSGHTEAILTEDAARARRFVRAVDAASVMVNASTRFADGQRYGLGAEVGVSTSKIHARGPVGVEGLTTTKWILFGNGHTTGPYRRDGGPRLRHEALDVPLEKGHA